MYIKKVTLENIRALRDLEITFDEPAGWHVLIGDNGSGKSSIVRAIAATLIGPEEIAAVLPIWDEWLSKGAEKGSITLELEPDWNYDQNGNGKIPKGKNIINKFILVKNRRGRAVLKTNINDKRLPPSNYNWSDNDGWFSAAYGPFRRFTGGDERRNKVFDSAPKAGAHLSVFGEDVALTEALEWLESIRERCNTLMLEMVQGEFKEDIRKILEVLEKGQELRNTFAHKGFLTASEFVETLKESKQIDDYFIKMKKKVGFQEMDLLYGISDFINKNQLLPHNTHLSKEDIAEFPLFLDGFDNKIPMIQMSDGFRSVLSFVLELIRQLISTYGQQKVFENREKETFSIDVPGVVLVDEIDTHLHPTWQTKIGEWFTTYFPNIQFIVTTHSPLVCRAARKGSIWKLATPGSDIPARKLTGLEKDRLVYGNILDAFGTEAFGQTPVRSSQSNQKKERLGELNIKAALGSINEEEEKERQNLQKILSTDAPVSF